jgi:hypothetical protein
LVERFLLDAWVITNVSELPHTSWKLPGDLWPARSKARGATNTIHQLEREPSALGVEEQFGDLTITVWRLNLSKI